MFIELQDNRIAERVEREKRKENLSHYGIEQCLIIDHHPNWRNTTAAIINVGLTA